MSGRQDADTVLASLLDDAPDGASRLEVALLAGWLPRTLERSPHAPGTVLREHAGLTKRANSILVLHATERQDLSWARRWYADRGLEPLAMVPSAGPRPADSTPPRAPEILVMTASLAHLVAPTAVLAHAERASALPAGPLGAEVGLDVRAPAALVSSLAARAPQPAPGDASGAGPTAEALALARALLEGSAVQVFATTPAGSVARLALTPVDATAVLDGVHVPAGARRGGEATAMILALAARARREGAQRLALEVECTNAPALACYRRLGFTVHHRHRYLRLLRPDEVPGSGGVRRPDGVRRPHGETSPGRGRSAAR